MRIARTKIENIRRRDLVEAAYQTFLDQGMKGMTMARIGERAGMSHGIVNYYFKSKDELLSAVVRKANFEIMGLNVVGLRKAKTPRERVSAVIHANFSGGLFTREVARAWASYYAMIGDNPEFGRMQKMVDRRLTSNLVHALKQLTNETAARDIAACVAVLIDGLWLRRAMTADSPDANSSISLIEDVVDLRLARAAG